MRNVGVLLCTGNSGSIDGVNDDRFSDEIAFVCAVKREELICLIKDERIGVNVAVFPSQVTELQKGQLQVRREWGAHTWHFSGVKGLQGCESPTVSGSKCGPAARQV